MQIWVRPISPDGSFAVAFLNLAIGGGPHKLNITCTDLGLTSSRGYHIVESFTGDDLGVFMPQDVFTCFVNPSGVFLITASL